LPCSSGIDEFDGDPAFESVLKVDAILSKHSFTPLNETVAQSGKKEKKKKNPSKTEANVVAKIAQNL
jgi:hypothetical protein